MIVRSYEMEEFIDTMIKRLEANCLKYKEYDVAIGINVVKELIHQHVAEYNNGWILYSADNELPLNGQRVWLSFTKPARIVKTAWYIDGHFEWDNGKKVRRTPAAWQPYKVPEPYEPKGVNN